MDGGMDDSEGLLVSGVEIVGCCEVVLELMLGAVGGNELHLAWSPA